MDNDIEHLTPFDNAITSKQFQIIKTALPYMPVSEQKIISLFVKTQELKNTIQLYNGNSEENIGVCSINGNVNDNLAEMVNCIKPLCNDNEKEQLDFFYNIICAFNLSHEAQNQPDDNSSDSGKEGGSTNQSPFNMANTLRAMLSPEQQTLLDTCSLMFGMNK